jgi:hypothetical protein
VLVLAVVSGLFLLWSATSPSVESGGAVSVEDAHVGTAYGFDGVVCLASGALGGTVHRVEVEQVDGASVRLVERPDDAPFTLGFPVELDEDAGLEGREVTGGELDCLTRLVVVPDREGSLQPGRVRVTYAYGPGGLLRRSASLEPQVDVQVTRTGPDPRADAG